jgi:hypothetical protein
MSIKRANPGEGNDWFGQGAALVAPPPRLDLTSRGTHRRGVNLKPSGPITRLHG